MTELTDCKCPFNHTLITRTFSCPRGQEVARRAGPDIACRNAASAARCADLHDRFKLAGLAAFGQADDLLNTPASTLQKIQYGGLLGLARLLGHPSVAVSGASAAGSTITDIDALVAEAVTHFGGLPQIPCAETTAEMVAYKLNRRRG